MVNHALLLRDENNKNSKSGHFKWIGSELELIEILNQLQIYGEWKDIECGKQFVSKESWKFVWYPNKNSIQVQGNPQKRKELISVFQALIDNPNDLRCTGKLF